MIVIPQTSQRVVSSSTAQPGPVMLHSVIHSPQPTGCPAWPALSTYLHTSGYSLHSVLSLYGRRISMKYKSSANKFATYSVSYSVRTLTSGLLYSYFHHLHLHNAIHKHKSLHQQKLPSIQSVYLCDCDGWCRVQTSPQLSNHPVYPHPAPPGLTNVICSNQPIKRAGLLYPDMQAVFDKVMKYSVFILYKGPTNTLL